MMYVMVSALDSESSDPSSNLGGTNRIDFFNFNRKTLILCTKYWIE